MINIYFKTYGCTANYNSSEIMEGILKKEKFKIVKNINLADFIIINSCIVKEPTEEKIRRRIFDLLKLEKKIIVAGCMPRIYKEKLQFKNLYLIDTTQIGNIANLIKDIKNNKYSEKYLEFRNEIKVDLPKISREKYIGINQISEGCLGNCYYCITKLAKGKLFSYPMNKILRSIKKDLENNKEIWITSQDCASYGNEKGVYLLLELLKRIISLDKKFFLRIGMMNPNNVLKILPELLEIYKCKKIFKFLHIPIQSGSDKILREMNRNYNAKEILKIFYLFIKNFPDMHLSTDIIVGYPNETEKDFEKTLNLIKKIKPETLNISRFWPRPFTFAENFKKTVSEGVIKKRIIKLSNLHKDLCKKKNKKYINKQFFVLVDKKGLSKFPNTYLARDENYRLFTIKSNKNILGEYIKVKVKKINSHYLISEPVK
jgi:threonylcarbamoyladenosine tRNA methylthiotransferase CDKAL1